MPKEKLTPEEKRKRKTDYHREWQRKPENQAKHTREMRERRHPNERIIDAAVIEDGRQVWAIDNYRIELIRLTKHKLEPNWRWRVWNVVGNMTLGSGLEKGVRRCKAAAVKCLQEHANVD